MQKKQNNSLYTFSVTLISLSAVLLTLAAASARKQIEQKPAAPAALRAGVRGDFAGLVDIGGGRKMYLECRGTGSPTVVLVSGKGNRADIWNTPNPEKPGPVVFTEVARLTRVCAYDRPGTTGALASEPSRSDPVPEPITVADAVVDLHALLIASKEPGPFVLVGHSIGGLISRLYASTYPRDVSGLVLIDALSEDLYKRLTPEQQAVFEKLNDVPERYDNVRSFEQVRAAPPVRAMPIVVLTADHSPITSKDIASGRFPPGVTAKFADALWAAQVPAQDSLARLFPNAKHITNTNSSHYIQIDQPQLVIDSIREVVDAVRNSGASPRNETGNELPPIAESSRIALEKALDEAFSKSGLPGVITGLWIPGTGSWIASRGVSDLKTKAPMTADLQAPIGSVTKSFAITIALQLVGEGRLRLEDTIERWYPQIPDASAITIKMLLNHSSGFPDISMLQLDLRCANPKRVVSPDELIAMGIKLPRAKFAPGKSSLYSSLNTIVLGRILEKITGQSFATLLSERLLNPLALHRTKLDTDGKLDPPFCHGYTDFCRNMPPHTDTSEWPQFSFASGALASTLLDLHRWGIALGEGFGLTPALRQTRIDEELGIGVQRERPGGRVISFGHAGSEAGYSANVQFYPCTGAVWALMANGDGGTGEIFMPVLKALQPIVEPLAVPSEKCAP
ncbi:MAG: alpha/beta fold hydrolase [Nitrospirota bacterium]